MKTPMYFESDFVVLDWELLLCYLQSFMFVSVECNIFATTSFILVACRQDIVE